MAPEHERGSIRREALSPEIQGLLSALYLSGNDLFVDRPFNLTNGGSLTGTLIGDSIIPHIILSTAAGTHVGYDDAGTGTHTIWTGGTIQNKVDNSDILTVSSTGIAVGGRVQDITGYVTPVGGIILYGAASAPTGWLLCNGASLLRASYAALFAVIGTTFGSVDGTHFNVPDLTSIEPTNTKYIIKT